MGMRMGKFLDRRRVITQAKETQNRPETRSQRDRKTLERYEDD